MELHAGRGPATSGASRANSARSSSQGRPLQASPHSPSRSPRSSAAMVINAEFHAGLSGPAHASRHGPTREEEAQAPHRLFGHVDAAENFSVGRWLVGDAASLAEIEAEGRAPDLHRRNGALLQGAHGGPVGHAARAGRGSRGGARGDRGRTAPRRCIASWRIAIPRPPPRLRPSDRLRILRALEIFAATGRPLARFQGERGRGRC